MASSGFSIQNIPQLPPDPLFGLKARYTADTRTNKVDLGIGAYRDQDGKPWVLPSVKLAEKAIHEDPAYNHEYLPIAGLQQFTSAAAKVILGSDSKALKDDKVVSVQTLSGTGALHVAALFIKRFYKGSGSVYISSPTWANHIQVFETQGLKIESYPYWNYATKELDLKGFLGAINSAPEGSVFLLHACAHNPTGLDPTRSQWTEILGAIKKKNHLALFDSAYQGFASGSLENDAFAVRSAIDSFDGSLPILICQSFAKNVGMYGERAGVFHYVSATKDAALQSAVLSQLQKITRCELSNPPAYGAKIVSKILNTPELYAQWERDLVTMSSRIKEMRQTLRSELESLGTPGTWDHITTQQGMFSFTGLSKPQVDSLEKDHGVYLVGSGRASMAGFNLGNVKAVAKAIDQVVREASKL
ncbi:unnamed protein product [Kuraishia capsulata CBS 1993]|uniref:Aspartate aminotransferase n=1 Tax=Kuraishia capsulata CBS 1993 TaxID=1382522 RepID=W6MJI3_9ASCO|nr:uncharacterized protein KUCA_T00000568001 [Kuraishia capsulata CBS 1993]CDK24602.1 unnamed protein product [Kuraishia capsulata CBS 1993]